MKNKSLKVIYSSIDEYNNQVNEKLRLTKSIDTVLMGSKSKLDSLGLVNLLVIIEQNTEDEFNKSLTLADERAMSQKHSPFRTIGTLADYIDMLLNEIKNSE